MPGVRAPPFHSSLFASLSLAAAASENYKCPGSKSFVHASAHVTAVANAPCSDVKAEMVLRVNGQFDQWHDPHNNGTYALTSDHAATDGDDVVKMSRLSGDKKYTDKMVFVLSSTGDNECTLYSCSESQVTSIIDFGTNYCNLRMMYCGSADGCKPVTHDITSKEVAVSTSSP